MNQIFVQIAAYRDPELIPTIEDCLSKAAFPERLTFGIAWQHADVDKWDKLTKYKKLKNFRILDIDYKDAKGVCWARYEIQKLYRGERYTLQLDSHHRFDKHWDITLVRMLQDLQQRGHKKPLLTAYATSYNPDEEKMLSEEEIWKKRSREPWKLNFDRFGPDGVVHISPSTIDIINRSEPIPARFLSAHLIFTLGEFCTEVPYDPDYYFHGEEISLAVRSYTHGYDLFHPNKVVIWHEYTRSNKVKHWADGTEWIPRDLNAKEKNKKLLGVDMDPVDIPVYGLGTERTLHDYERYAGIEFKTRKLHDDTLKEKYLPISSTTEEDFQSKLKGYKKYCIDFYKGNLTETDDYDCLVVALKDKNGEEIYRKDSPGDEIEAMLKADPQNTHIQIWRSFYSETEAVGWVIWPHSKSKGWCTRYEGRL